MLPSPCGLRLGLWAWASTPRHASRQSVHALDPTRCAPRHINTPATSTPPAETLHTFEGMSDTYRELASLKLSPADLQVGAAPLLFLTEGPLFFDRSRGVYSCRRQSTIWGELCWALCRCGRGFLSGWLGK